MKASWTRGEMPDLTGQVALVTGANSGLGLHTARALVERGAEVVMACRDAGRGRAAADAIVAQVPRARLEVMTLDLADLASVRQFAGAMAARHARLDLQCNNAGVMALPRRVTRDGFEMQFGTNHLGHFALTGLLMPLLGQAPAPRVVTVSSLAHRIGRMRFDDLNGEQHYAKWPAYAQSKLANLLFANELARRLHAAGSPAISVAVHPGYAATALQVAGPAMEDSRVGKVMMRISNALFSQPAECGAMPTLRAATGADVRNGDFFGPEGWLQLHGAPVHRRAAPRADDLAAAARLWAVSERLTGVSYLSARQ